jgi:tetratricopeptide (TPR) repeat protein
MKLLPSFFLRLYKYSTACIVVASPLFFIPRTVFLPEVTYFITIMLLIMIASVSYVIHALITKKWNNVSKLEFISYFLFILAVIVSSFFSRSAQSSFFGQGLNSFSGISLISLPVIMYLVRSLPSDMRQKLKYILLTIVGFSAFVFILGLVYAGNFGAYISEVFSGFPAAMPFAVYLGLFVVVALFFTKKAILPIKHKIVIVVMSVIFLVWITSLAIGDSLRPNLSSSFAVAKSVMFNDGPFGIGPGNFSRAWQLYRPASVISSPYFGYDFNQSSDTMTTMFTTIGVFGLLTFLLLILSALYTTYLSYRKTRVGSEHFILGLITIILLYFSCVSWITPLSYSLLILWMVVSGLGIAKTELNESHPSKRMSLIMIPFAILIVVNMSNITQRAQAFALYSKAQDNTTPDGALNMLVSAVKIYPYDEFYRAVVEMAIASNRLLIAKDSSNKEEEQKRYLAKTELAIESAHKAIKLNSDNYQNYVSLGRAYEMAIPFSKESEYNNARLAYQEAIKLYPENPYLYIILARLEYAAGTIDRAKTEVKTALSKKENFADALYLMSQLEADDKNLEAALNYAILSIKNAPNDPLTYIQAGVLFYEKKDYQNAVIAFRTALEKDPNNENVAYFLSLALRDGGRPDVAKPVVDELLKRNPNNPDLISLLNSLFIVNATTTTSTKTSNTTPKKK